MSLSQLLVTEKSFKSITIASTSSMSPSIGFQYARMISDCLILPQKEKERKKERYINVF
jgi:hypothetical protein